MPNHTRREHTLKYTHTWVINTRVMLMLISDQWRREYSWKHTHTHIQSYMYTYTLNSPGQGKTMRAMGEMGGEMME